MYCTECGTQAQGKFCAHCGTAIQRADVPIGPTLAIVPASIPSLPAEVADWTQTIEYEAIVRVPEVRALIARAADQSEKRLSGEEFLRFCDKSFAPLYGGVSMETLASIVQPIYSALGVRTGKEQKRLYSKPPGNVIVSLLCSLARRGRTLRQVRQAADGCMFEATLPSDIWSLAGELLVEVRVEVGSTVVEAHTVVKGQFFDWGKSKRCLDELLSDLEMMPAAA